MFCNDTGHLRIIFQPPYVIDKISTGLNCCISNTSFVSIDRNRNIKVLTKCFDNGNNTCRFFFSTYRSMSRTGGFSTDIQNISSVSDHGFCMLQCMIHSIPFAAIRKGIRSHVQDPHDIGSVLYIKFSISDFHDQKISF